MKGLTPKQREILSFIQQFIEIHQYSPSYREIMQHFSFASPGSVYKHIRTLQRKGCLTSEKQCSRSLMTTQPLTLPKTEMSLELPLIGHIAAGYPIEIFVKHQFISAPASLVQAPANTYILRVQGDSFQEECIQDGDLLLIDARTDVQDGEMIVGLINQHDTFIKRYYAEDPYIRLESCHHQQQPLILRQEHLSIQGVIVGLIRAY